MPNLSFRVSFLASFSYWNDFYTSQTLLWRVKAFRRIQLNAKRVIFIGSQKIARIILGAETPWKTHHNEYARSLRHKYTHTREKQERMHLKFTNEAELVAWHRTFGDRCLFSFGKRKCMPKFKRWLRDFNDVRPSLIYHIWPLVTPYETNLQMTAIVPHCELYELDDSMVTFTSSLQ